MRSRLLLLFIPIAIVALTGCSSSRSLNTYTQAKANFAEQNYYDAYQKLLVPAAKGNPDAEYALGYLYYYGKGTPANQILGKQWILKAAQDGNQQAAEAYQMIIGKEQAVMPISASLNVNNYHPKTLAQPVSKRPIVLPTSRVSTIHKHQKHHSGAAKKHLLAAKKTDYTLQLFDATTAAHASAFINKYKLGKSAYYFQRKLNGKSLYVVVYGTYPSKATAAKAVTSLPAIIQQLRPWVRSLSSVQAEIRKV